MGGTEIYSPMKAIFEQNPASNDLTRHIFLLTDGAVYDTDKLVSLIGQNSSLTDTRVHTLGIGSGASSQLVKEAAGAGSGSYFFVEHTDKLEETVIKALQKNYIPTRTL